MREHDCGREEMVIGFRGLVDIYDDEYGSGEF